MTWCHLFKFMPQLEKKFSYLNENMLNSFQLGIIVSLLSLNMHILLLSLYVHRRAELLCNNNV